MILTLILLSIGALLFLVIAYNVVQQYKQKAESDKRQAIARHKAVADETEEVLLNVNLVPFSKNMVLLLQHRILDAYRAIALVMPNAQVKQRIADVQLQIKNVQENYSSQDEGHFKTPESDRQAIQMLQLAERMRPMLLATEQEVISAVHAEGLPIVKSVCPADGVTVREQTKEFVKERCRTDHAFRQKTLHALQESGIDGWRPVHTGRGSFAITNEEE
jgi:hypothetical protein